MYIAKLFSFLILLSALAAIADEVVFRADFSGKNALQASGWEIVSSPEQSLYAAKDGVLQVTCMQKPMNGGFMRLRVPVLNRGKLEFDACIAAENAGNCLGVGLTIDVYNISTWFHDYCKDWRRYFPEPPSQRIAGYKMEPVGHRRLTTVPKGEWAHYAIVFDHEAGIVEYYRNNMDDPVMIDYDVPVLGRAEFQGGEIRIGNMGITRGAVVHEIRNLTLSRIDPTAESSGNSRTDLIVFRGIAADEYGLDATLRSLASVGKTHTYTLSTHGAAVSPKNLLKLDNLPSAKTIQRASAIALLDMPAGPGEILPHAFQRQIVEAVQNGAKLIVFGGMFSFGKGVFQYGPLARILPIELGGPWEVQKLPEPQSLIPEDKSSFEKQSSPLLQWYHANTVRPRASILMKTDDRIPIVARQAVGDGSVIVFLGIPAGISQTSTGIPFWQSSSWKEWMKKKIEE